MYFQTYSILAAFKFSGSGCISFVGALKSRLRQRDQPGKRSSRATYSGKAYEKVYKKYDASDKSFLYHTSGKGAPFVKADDDEEVLKKRAYNKRASIRREEEEERRLPWLRPLVRTQEMLGDCFSAKKTHVLCS
jgi:hypothetical protein